jgi:DNA (cytosine-5)-methyltransferase 1
VDKVTGHEYNYSEGGMAFPDPLNRPSRTILTGEGGISASRFKHIIEDPRTGRFRRLVPEELEELQGFPRGWTDTGMSDGKRAFMMGNALVVGVVARIGRAIKDEAEACLSEKAGRGDEQTRTSA